MWHYESVADQSIGSQTVTAVHLGRALLEARTNEISTIKALEQESRKDSIRDKPEGL